MKTLNVGQYKSEEELHDYLGRELGFPEWHGHNWDAFWDCIRDPDLSNLSDKIEILGMSELEASLPRAASILRSTFLDLRSERPDVSIEFGSSEPPVR